MFEIWWWLQPSNLMAFALLLALLLLLLRRRAAAGFFLFLALTVLALPTVFGVGERLAYELERMAPRPAALPERVTGIIVLGGAVEWAQSQARGQLQLNAAGERVLAGAALARRYPEAQLVLTGLYRETVPDDFVPTPSGGSLIFGPEFAGRRVTFIGEARSTYEEALLALERLQPSAGEEWLLVTSAMHMPRALAVFRTLGWNLTPYPVDYQTAGEPRALDPARTAGRSLQGLDEAVREWAALLIYRATGRIG